MQKKKDHKKPKIFKLCTHTIHNLKFSVSQKQISNYIYIYITNGAGDLGLIPSRVIPKTQKMVLDTSLL